MGDGGCQFTQRRHARYVCSSACVSRRASEASTWSVRSRLIASTASTRSESGRRGEWVTPGSAGQRKGELLCVLTSLREAPVKVRLASCSSGQTRSGGGRARDQRDLTDHVLASEALRETQAELAHVTRVTTLGELTASIAHEVNQPLAPSSRMAMHASMA